MPAGHGCFRNYRSCHHLNTPVLLNLLSVILGNQDRIKRVFCGCIDSLEPIIIEERMIITAITANPNKITKALKLQSVRERAVAVNGVILFEIKQDKGPVFFDKTRFMIIAHQGGSHASGVVISAMQAGLIDDRGFF